jgi:site-specific recombinase XerD
MKNNQALVKPSARKRPSFELPKTDILAGQITKSSQRMYKRDIAAYATWAESEGLQPLKAATFARWRTALSEATYSKGKSKEPHGYSPHTINRMLAAVKRLMAEAAEQGLLSRKVAGEFADRRGVKVLALKEQLKEHARTYIAPANMRRLAALPDISTLKGTRDAALLHTLASSGIRVSEAASLTVDAIQAINGGYLLSVCGKTDETARQAPLSVEAYQAIQAWLMARPVSSPYIFTAQNGRGNRWSARPMHTRKIEELVSAYAEGAGLQHVKPHDFRRFVGTQLARQDIRKAQLALGHKSIETTARHYDLGKLEPGLTDGLY